MKRPTVGKEIPEEAKLVEAKTRSVLVRFGIAATTVILAAAGMVDYQQGTLRYSLVALSFLGPIWWAIYHNTFSVHGERD